MAKDTKVEVVESAAKAEYRRIIEAYKIKNPVKYEIKKKAFEAKLATL